MSWSIQLASGEYLEAVPELAFEYNNMVFQSADNTILPGSYSFPFDVPLTRRNKQLLGNPHLITNSTEWEAYQVTVYVYGLALFAGKMTIRDCNAAAAKVNINSNPLYDLKSIKLNQVYLGGTRTFASGSALLAHAKDTALAPLDYDCVFFPVYNPDFINEFTGDRKSLFQNYWSTTTQAFSAGDTFPVVTPFVRLEYLLTQIFSSIDYAFENRFQVNEELRQLCVYSNKSLYTVQGLGSSYNLQEHVSDTAATAFVRHLMGGFCLGIYINPFTKRIRLEPLAAILQRPAQHDWTQYAIGEPSITTNEMVPEILEWENDPNDAIWELFSSNTKPTPAEIDGEVDSDGLFAAGAGLYYVTDRQQYWEKQLISGFLKLKYGDMGIMPASSGSPVFQAKLQPLYEYQPRYDYPEPHLISRVANVPWCYIKGTIQYPDADGEQVDQQSPLPDRLMMYRGMQEALDNNDYPCASSLPYDRHGAAIGNYSLHWDGELGMYNKWWLHWHQIIYQGKHCTQSLALPVAVLQQFGFDEKIRIGSMDYIVKKLNVQRLLGGGLIQVEANLVSTV